VNGSVKRSTVWSVGPVLFAVACGGETAPATNTAAATVRLAAVETTTVAVPVALTAQIWVEHDASVFARASGIVEAVLVDLGTRVRGGDVLARLEDVDQRLALEEAEQSHANALSLATRARRLAGSGAITVADSEQFELDLRLAEVRLGQARRAEQFTRVTAPFAGAVTARAARRGRLVSDGDSLFRITALGPLLVSVRVPESAGGSAPGDSARVVSRSGIEIAATVDRMSPTIDPASGTREVVLRLEQGSGLTPGASVEVYVGHAPRVVLAIPDGAVTEGGYVLVWENGRSALRAVQLGATLDGGRREVVSGLMAGEQVVLATR